MNDPIWHSSLGASMASVSSFVIYVLEDVDWLLDVDGRPLGEQRAPAARQGVRTELQRCPYSGSRHHHGFKMNVSALRQIAAHWGAVREDMSCLRSEHLRRTNRDGMALRDLWRVSTAARLLPAYLYFSGRARDRELPVSVSALYKSVVGIVALLEAMLTVEGVPLDAAVTGDDIESLIEFADGSGLLIGSRQVCPAPLNMMREALDILAFGGPSCTRPSSPLCSLPIGDFFSFVDTICTSIARRANFSRGLFECAERLGEILPAGAGAALASFQAAGPLGRVDPHWVRLSPPRRMLARARLFELVVPPASAYQTTGAYAYVPDVPPLSTGGRARAVARAARSLGAALPEAHVGPAARLIVESAWAELSFARASTDATTTVARLLSSGQSLVPLRVSDVSTLFRTTPAAALSSLLRVRLPAADELIPDV